VESGLLKSEVVASDTAELAKEGKTDKEVEEDKAEEGQFVVVEGDKTGSAAEPAVPEPPPGGAEATERHDEL
jgi:hypothetical protein